MTNKLPVRSLGTTAIQVTELGFGGASLGNLYQAVSDATAEKTLAAAIQAGFGFFDTAPYYGLGLSERRVGDALRGLDKDDYVISTKVGRLLNADADVNTHIPRYGFHTPMPFEPEFDYSYEGIMRSYESSMQRMGLAKIDILLVHDIGELTHGDRDTHFFDQLIAGGYKALEELRRNGDITAFGLGVNEYQVCERAMDTGQYDCFLLAGRYTLLEQQPLVSFLPKCQKHGASIILGGPYNSGILATGVRTAATPHYNYEPADQAIIDRVASIEKICDNHSVSLAAAALQFPLAHPSVVSIVPGLGSQKRISETVRIFHEEIPTEFWRELKNGGLISQDAPVPQ